MAITQVTLEEITGVATLDVETTEFVREWSKDFNIKRASELVYRDSFRGYSIINENPKVWSTMLAIKQRLEAVSAVTPDMVLNALWDNHKIAQQEGKINASNKALDQIAKHKMVDANASSKMDIVAATDQEMVDRIRKGRARVVESEKKPLSFV